MERIGLWLVVSGAKGPRQQIFRVCLDCLFGAMDRGQVAQLSDEVGMHDVIEFDQRRIKAGAQMRVKKSQRREIEAAGDIGGRKVSQSGGGISKGDARNERWMVEDKYTNNKTYLLDRKVISKALAQAAQTGRRAVIRVGLGDGTELAITSWNDFKEAICEETDDD